MSNTNDKTPSGTTHNTNGFLTPSKTTGLGSESGYVNASKAGKRRVSLRKLILPVGFILLIIAAGTFAANVVGRSNSGSASNKIQSVFSGEELNEYTSPDNDFTILMPGVPEITDSNSKAGDKDVPVTTYTRTIENGAKNYTLAVYDYSGIKIEETAALEAALDSAMQSTPGAEVVSTNLGKFRSYNAIEANYKVVDNDNIYQSRIRYIIDGSTMYAMILFGGDEVEFNEFANSLRLN